MRRRNSSAVRHCRSCKCVARIGENTDDSLTWPVLVTVDEIADAVREEMNLAGLRTPKISFFAGDMKHVTGKASEQGELTPLLPDETPCLLELRRTLIPPKLTRRNTELLQAYCYSSDFSFSTLAGEDEPLYSFQEKTI
ncbi:unnamed protein product [Victoria cruziana]